MDNSLSSSPCSHWTFCSCAVATCPLMLLHSTESPGTVRNAHNVPTQGCPGAPGVSVPASPVPSSLQAPPGLRPPGAAAAAAPPGAHLGATWRRPLEPPTLWALGGLPEGTAQRERAVTRRSSVCAAPAPFLCPSVPSVPLFLAPLQESALPHSNPKGLGGCPPRWIPSPSYMARGTAVL